MSDWGKGSENNNIGWGQAAGSATNDWGKSQKNSYAGQTDIVGLTTLSINYSADNYCEDGGNTPQPTVSNNAGAGTFSSTTGLVIDGVTGIINTDTSTVGTYTVTYTDTDAATATDDVVLRALPTIIVSVSAGTICDGESTTLTATGASTYVWSNGDTGSAITVSPSATTIFTATGSDGFCTSAGSTTITVNAQDSAAFSYAASVYCANGTDPTPTITGTSGGAFTSTTGLVINSGTGAIDLDASTVGAYLITYTTTGVCPANQSVNLTINAADNAAFSYSASSFEPTDADPTPTITGLTGGTFSAGSGLVFVDSGTNTGSSTGEIDLSASTAASYTITYDTTSSDSSVCPNTSTFSLTVAAAYSPFQMQFSVTSGVSKTITISNTVGSSYTVDWGDGATTTESAGNISHIYNDGTNTDVTNPTVSIGAAGDSGAFTALKFNGGVSRNDLLKVQQWGNIQFSTFTQMFYACTNLDINATDAPDLSNVSDFYRAFFGCSSLTGTLSGVNMQWTFKSGSFSFQGMFFRCPLFNGDISNWNTTGLASTANLFSCSGAAKGVFNRDLNSWNTSNVTNMSGMFLNQSFNGNISNWDTSSVTNVSNMFNGSSFNQDVNTKDYPAGNRLAWDVSSCSNFSGMFSGASIFSTSIDKWKIKTTGSNFSMSDMLKGTNYNQNLNTSEVTVGQGGYQQTYLAWDVQKVNNFYRMFDGSSFNQSLSNWDTSSATNMNTMFSANSFNQPITTQSVTVGSGSNQRTYNAWNVSLVGTTFRMFRGNSAFNQDLSSWDVSGLSDIGQMFSYGSVFNQNLSSWNIINLSNAQNSFVGNNILTQENYTDTVVGWAVTVYKNGGTPSSVSWTGTTPNFDGTRTSDDAAGQTYAVKYGSDWTATGWTNSQDAFDYLTTTLSWTIN